MSSTTALPINGKLGFWMTSLGDDRRSFAPLQGDDSVDVAIVGGGYTGLWAAYFAKQLEPSLSVAVFEAETLGYGASGRNGGWVSALSPGNRATFARKSPSGKAGSTALQREFVSSVDDILATLEREGIDADQHKGGTLSAAHTRAGMTRLLAKREADLSYGLTADEVQVLNPEEFRARIDIADVHGGLFYPDVARVHPAKLLYGLVDAAVRLGVRFHEQSPVLSIDRRNLTLPGGTVQAGRVLVCTEGYSGPLMGRRRLVPINSSMIVTQRLDDAGNVFRLPG